MDASLRAAQRLLTEWQPAMTPAGEAVTLETTVMPVEPARVIAAELLEDPVCRARRVAGDPEPGIAAFLDGIQQSRVVHHVGGVPVVLGMVAAAVRVRVERRLATWGGVRTAGSARREAGSDSAEGPGGGSPGHEPPGKRGANPEGGGSGVLVSRRLYLPRGRVPADLWRLAAARGFAPVDTTEPNENGDPSAAHPAALAERAVHAVQREREALEQELGARWCAAAAGVLLADGSINRDERVADSPRAVGVVKSHRTLYVDATAMETVFALRAGERSTVMIVTSPRAVPVASWYLRLRNAGRAERGGDPLFGLVRVEAALPDTLRRDPRAAGRRADEVSRWLLAERWPLSLPDGRWDRLVYGVRGVEEFLRAIV